MTESSDQLKGEIPGRIFRDHPALLVSGLYVFATAIGMFFSWSYLRHFGINVFLYAEIGDFLMASFKDPVIWIVVITMIVAWYVDIRASTRWGARDRMRGLRWYGTKAYRRLSYPSGLLALIVILSLAAADEAEDAREGRGDVVNVRLADADTVRSGILLETTARFVIVFDTTTQTVHAYPHEGITEVFFVAPAREE